jgi:hypothetical protein
MSTEIEVYQNEDTNIDFTVKIGGVAQNISDYTAAKFLVKTNLGDDDGDAILSKVKDDGITLPNAGTDGVLRVAIVDVDFAALELTDDANYRYGLRISSATIGGDKVLVGNGSFQLRLPVALEK